MKWRGGTGSPIRAVAVFDLVTALLASNHSGTRLSASARAAGLVPLCTWPRAVDRERAAGAHLQRPVRMIEVVVRAGIDVDRDPALRPRAPATICWQAAAEAWSSARPIRISVGTRALQAALLSRRQPG